MFEKMFIKYVVMMYNKMLWWYDNVFWGCSWCISWFDWKKYEKTLNWELFELPADWEKNNFFISRQNTFYCENLSFDVFIVIFGFPSLWRFQNTPKTYLSEVIQNCSVCLKFCFVLPKLSCEKLGGFNHCLKKSSWNC